MKNFNEIVFILDRSGSMRGLESDVVGGFNSLLQEHQEKNPNSLISTVLFNHESRVVHDRVPITEIKPLTAEDYKVGGTTALLDACSFAIKHIRTVHKYTENKSDKTFFFITTDGLENASHNFSYNELKLLIEQQKEVGWEFVFFGANIDAFSVASDIGISSDRAVNFHRDSAGIGELFSACSNFFSDAITSEDFNKLPISWRKNIDQDFNKRNH